MAGIYVNAGAAPGNTVGGVTVPSTCDPLFYRNGCNPRFDPIATNNLMSEVLRAINAFGDQYNCESQDNLRNVILKARNLCGLPVIAPDLDDFIAGCYDGVSGLAPIQQLQSLFGICNLPTATAPDLDDTVGMCVDGFNSKVPLSALVDVITGQLPSSGPGAYNRGGGFFQGFTNQSGNVKHFSTAGQTAFFFGVGPLPPVPNETPDTWVNLRNDDFGGEPFDVEMAILVKGSSGNWYMQKGADPQWHVYGTSDSWNFEGGDSNSGGIGTAYVAHPISF